MRRFQKSKTVSWPSDVNLCQVKLFLSEESPSLIGLSAQDHLHAKASLNSKGAGSVDKLPPGFDGTNPAYAFHNKFSKIPIIQWKCPPKFVFDLVWQVVAGEESSEVECQNQRVMRVLEAVYPRPSAIPPNPSLLSRQEDSHDSNLNTPLVPITPIEEDETAADTSFSNISQSAALLSSQSQLSATEVRSLESSSINNPNCPANFIPPSETALGVEPDIIAAAYTALSALMANNVDPDLLVRILRDPNIMEKLGSSHAASTNPDNIPKPRSEGISLPAPSEVHINRRETVASSLVTSPCQPLHFPVGRPGLVPNPDNMPKPRSEGIRLPAPSEVHINRTETVGSSLGTFPCQPLHSPVGRPRLVPNPHNMPKPRSEGISLPAPSEVHINRTETVASSLVTSPYQPLHSPVVRPGCVPNLSLPLAARPLGAPVTKDINYYKSLIQQHGSERQQKPIPLNFNNVLRPSQESVSHPRSTDLKPKMIMKPCVYFNSSKGCRYGANCAYQHDVLSQQHRVNSLPDLQGAKRMKMDKEITGTKSCIWNE